MVASRRRHNRALKAIELAAQLPKDPKEGLATLELAMAAYRASLGECGPSYRPVLKQWMIAASIALIAISTFEFFEHGLSDAVAAHGPAMVIGSARLVSDMVQEGDKLEVVATHKYLRACDWWVKRDWYEGKTKIAVTKLNLPAIRTDPEFQNSRWPVDLPSGLKPGNYRFAATLSAYCDHDEKFTYKIFEQNFTLLPKASE